MFDYFVQVVVSGYDKRYEGFVTYFVIFCLEIIIHSFLREGGYYFLICRAVAHLDVLSTGKVSAVFESCGGANDDLAQSASVVSGFNRSAATPQLDVPREQRPTLSPLNLMEEKNGQLRRRKEQQCVWSARLEILFQKREMKAPTSVLITPDGQHWPIKRRLDGDPNRLRTKCVVRLPLTLEHQAPRRRFRLRLRCPLRPLYQQHNNYNNSCHSQKVHHHNGRMTRAEKYGWKLVNIRRNSLFDLGEGKLQMTAKDFGRYISYGPFRESEAINGLRVQRSRSMAIGARLAIRACACLTAGSGRMVSGGLRLTSIRCNPHSKLSSPAVEALTKSISPGRIDFEMPQATAVIFPNLLPNWFESDPATELSVNFGLPRRNYIEFLRPHPPQKLSACWNPLNNMQRGLLWAVLCKGHSDHVPKMVFILFYSFSPLSPPPHVVFLLFPLRNKTSLSSEPIVVHAPLTHPFLFSQASGHRECEGLFSVLTLESVTLLCFFICHLFLFPLFFLHWSLIQLESSPSIFLSFLSSFSSFFPFKPDLL
ncbi:hypothetical protein VP01_3301g1 [Puccinia sorghi]|uniref:Uncharacterized protein n=1 Tax=Puccinia sorghi TaxID=27349 RepID=A0A0L6UXH9_9BASI|nr:hypothetical protein VP01_3301g1 [Puccinia sorghi]